MACHRRSISRLGRARRHQSCRLLGPDDCVTCSDRTAWSIPNNHWCAELFSRGREWQPQAQVGAGVSSVAVGYFVGTHPAVKKVFDRYGQVVVPFVLIGLGLYIIFDSGILGIFGRTLAK